MVYSHRGYSCRYFCILRCCQQSKGKSRCLKIEQQRNQEYAEIIKKSEEINKRQQTAIDTANKIILLQNKLVETTTQLREANHENLKLSKLLTEQATNLQVQNVSLQLPLIDDFSVAMEFDLEFENFSREIDSINEEILRLPSPDGIRDQITQLPNWYFPKERFNYYQDLILREFGNLNFLCLEFIDKKGSEILKLEGSGMIENIPLKEPIAKGKVRNDIGEVISYLARDNKFLYDLKSKKFRLILTVPLKIISKKLTTTSILDLAGTKLEVTTTYGLLHLNVDSDKERSDAIKMNQMEKRLEPNSIAMKALILKSGKSVVRSSNKITIENFKFVIDGV